MSMTRSFILAAALSGAVSAAASGQTSCDEMRQLRMDMVWEEADAAFNASTRKAKEAHREEFQTATANYAQALASVEAGYDGSLYWVFRFTNAEQLDHSATADPVTAAAAKRAHDRNAAHREWASTVSEIMSRWSASMEEAEIRRSAFIGENALLIENQLSDCQ